MTRSIPTLMLPLLLAGCAYGYAGQEGRQRKDPQPESNVRVVEVKDAPSSTNGASDDAAETPAPAKAESPCGVDTFDIHYYADGDQITKTIDCSSRTIVNVTRTPMGETNYTGARAAGLPEGSWYILVDPKGAQSGVLNNAALLKLSLVFDIDYFGRDTARDLLVYLYVDQPR